MLWNLESISLGNSPNLSMNYIDRYIKYKHIYIHVYAYTCDFNYVNPNSKCTWMILTQNNLLSFHVSQKLW